MCVRFALVCCALRVDFIKSLRLTNTVIIIIIIRKIERQTDRQTDGPTETKDRQR